MLKLRYYIDNPSARKMWKARTEVISAVKDAFAAEDITIPYPQRELSGRPGADAFAVSGVGASEVSDDGSGTEDADTDDTEDAADTDDGRVEREAAAANGSGNCGDGGDETDDSDDDTNEAEAE